jgi:histidyl-tRNA synthetase
LAWLLGRCGVDSARHESVMHALDRFAGSGSEISAEALVQEAKIAIDQAASFIDLITDPERSIEDDTEHVVSAASSASQPVGVLRRLSNDLVCNGLPFDYRSGWWGFDLTIARGLAYYTGTVFAAIAQGERAIAGGGRYDGLIELFGGPPTPAVGFAMGDAVLSLLLEDKGLMPEGAELLEAVSRPPASWRPDAFVFASPGFPEAAERGDGPEARTTEDGPDAAVKRLVADLRRGRESEAWLERRESGKARPWDRDRYEVPPLHARRSYRATRNVGKLLKEAASQHARYAVILEDPERCTVKILDTGEQFGDVPLKQVGAVITRG